MGGAVADGGIDVLEGTAVGGMDTHGANGSDEPSSEQPGPPVTTVNTTLSLVVLGGSSLQKVPGIDVSPGGKSPEPA